MITWHARDQIVTRLGGIVTQMDVCRMNSAAIAFPEGKSYVIIRHLPVPEYRRGTSGDCLVAVVENGDVTTAMLSWNEQPNRWADGTRKEFADV